MDKEVAAAKQPAKKLPSGLVRTAIVMTIGMLCPMLGVNIVNVAIQTIGVDMGASIDLTQWLVTAYVLCMGIAIPVSGWFVDRFPAKPVYLISLGAFTVASFLAGLPGNIGILIAWRCVQGFASGVMIQLIQTILMREAGTANRGRIMALVSVPSVIIPILGPVVGGIIIQFLPWRWVFLINVPLGAIALGLAVAFLPHMPITNRDKKLDVVGNIMLAVGFCAMLMGISGLRGTNLSSAFAMLAVGVVVLAIYTLYAIRAKGDITLDVKLFKLPSFTACIILMFLYSAVSQGILFVLPLYMQGALGMSAMTAGLMLAPQGLGMLVTRSWAGKQTDTRDPRVICLIGIVLMILGTLPFVLFGLGNNTGSVVFSVIVLFVRGMGLGIVMIPITACIYTGLDAKQIADGTTGQRIFQQIGSAVGTAAMAIILAALGAAGGVAAGATAGVAGAATGAAGAAASFAGIAFLGVPIGYAIVFGLSCAILAVMVMPLMLMTRQASEKDGGSANENPVQPAHKDITSAAGVNACASTPGTQTQLP